MIGLLSVQITYSNITTNVFFNNKETDASENFICQQIYLPQNQRLNEIFHNNLQKHFVKDQLGSIDYMQKCMCCQYYPYSGWVVSGLLTDKGGGGGWPKWPPALKSVTHHTLMKLDTVIPYQNKIRKIHKSCDTPLEFY